MRHQYLKRLAVFAISILVVGLSAGVYGFRSAGGEQSVPPQFLASYDRPLNGGLEQSKPRVLQAASGEHPLSPCMRWAKNALHDARRIKDYSCTLVKRERIDGALIGPQCMAVKVRHHPFSVYMRFLEPTSLRGREVIYVQGQNDDKLLCHLTGVRHRLLGTVALPPSGHLAMADNRYPITEVGVLRLVERLIDVGESDINRDNCEVRVTRVSFQGRPCTYLEVEHPQPQLGLLFHQAKIYVDEELNLPVRYAAYDWPDDARGAPGLIEEYTYLDLKLNRGFTDQDFDPKSPDYAFARNAGPKEQTAP